jgi:hypothetical protein
VWGHVIEKVVEKLDFSQKLGPQRGQKFKEMALAKNFVPAVASFCRKNYIQLPFLVYSWSRLKSQISV